MCMGYLSCVCLEIPLFCQRAKIFVVEDKCCFTKKLRITASHENISSRQFLKGCCNV